MKPEPVIVTLVAVPSRIAFGVTELGVVMLGAGVMVNRFAYVVAPPLAFVTVADSPPVVAPAGTEIVPKMPLGVTDVTVAVAAVPPEVTLDNVTVALAKKPVPTMWNGTAVEPTAIFSVGTVFV
jgi:hypothetical protein